MPATGSSLLRVLENKFPEVVTQDPPLELDGWDIGGSLPARHIRLDELVELLRGSTIDRQTKDAIWADLIRRTRSGEERWVSGALGVMLPGLRRAVRRIKAEVNGNHDDLEIEAVLGFLEALKAVPPETRGLSSLLWQMTYQWCLATRPRVEAPQDRPTSIRPVPLVSREGHVDLVLSRAIEKGVLSALEAEVIGRNRIEGTHLFSVAEDLGLAYEDCVRASRSAEPRLVRHLVREGNS